MVSPPASTAVAATAAATAATVPEAATSAPANATSGTGARRCWEAWPALASTPWRPFRELGKGAFGGVVAVSHARTGVRAALKRLSPLAATRSDGLQQLREVRLLRELGSHPNCLGLVDLIVVPPLPPPPPPAPPPAAGVTHVVRAARNGGAASGSGEPPSASAASGELFIVTQLLDTDLHRVIVSSQDITEAHIKHLCFQLLRGLRFAHARGVIHRDVKPANLLVSRACDLVIADFGLARQMPEGDGPMTEHVVTRWYRAPELMLSPDGVYGPGVDIWAAGCVLAELLGRKPLFSGKSYHEVVAMQIQVLGTRPTVELEYIRSDDARAFLRQLPLATKASWRVVFPNCSPKCAALLDALLAWHPSARCTAAQALDMPFFAGIRDLPLYSDPEPLLRGGDLDSFECASTEELRTLLIAEADSVHAEQRALNEAID